MGQTRNWSNGLVLILERDRTIRVLPYCDEKKTITNSRWQFTVSDHGDSTKTILMMTILSLVFAPYHFLVTDGV